jgi:hypothetical protein
VVEVTFVVREIEEAMQRYSELLNVGPWTLFERISVSNLVYRGQPSALNLTLAEACSGHVLVALVQQNDDEPSVFNEAPEERRYGFHHWGLATTDFERDLRKFEQQGYEVALSANLGDSEAPEVIGRHVMIDTTHDLGGWVVLIEMVPAEEARRTEMYRQALGWDGQDRVRLATV